MALDKTVEVQQLNVTTADKYVTFEGGVNGFVLTCSSQDVFVDFDVPASSATGFLVKKDVTNNQWDFRGGSVKQLHAVTGSSTATLYIIGVRN